MTIYLDINTTKLVKLIDQWFTKVCRVSEVQVRQALALCVTISIFIAGLELIQYANFAIVHQKSEQTSVSVTLMPCQTKHRYTRKMLSKELRSK